MPSTCPLRIICAASIPAITARAVAVVRGTLHGPQPPFHMAVVGFDAVTRVAAGSMPTTTAQVAFTLQFSNGSWITA